MCGNHVYRSRATTPVTSSASRDGRAHRALQELSGSFGDIGTLLPYIVPLLATDALAPVPVLLGFATGYLFVALHYRLPIPVQPMKALGAIALAGGLDAVGIGRAGVALGAVLLLLACVPSVEKWLRLVPDPVIGGLRVGLGLMLGATAFELVGPALMLPALALLALPRVLPRVPWALLLVLGSIVWGTSAAPSFLAPSVPVPTAEASGWLVAIGLGVLSQLPLTLLNAIVLTTTLAHELYGERAWRVQPRALLFGTGVLNLALAPLGAMPMCHGAGGLVAHHRFGARGIGAPLVLAALCLIGALAAATDMADVASLLARIPAPAIGILLAQAAADLVFSRRLLEARADCLVVIVFAALLTLTVNAAVGLLGGLVGEWLRRRLLDVRHRAR